MTSFTSPEFVRLVDAAYTPAAIDAAEYKELRSVVFNTLNDVWVLGLTKLSDALMGKLNQLPVELSETDTVSLEALRVLGDVVLERLGDRCRNGGLPAPMVADIDRIARSLCALRVSQ